MRTTAPCLTSDVAVILPEAGRTEEALGRVQRNLQRFLEDVWTAIDAGYVHLALADPARAEQTFRDALAMAHAHGDASTVAFASERLSRLLAEQPGREHAADAAPTQAGRPQQPRCGRRRAPRGQDPTQRSLPVRQRQRVQALLRR